MRPEERDQVLVASVGDVVDPHSWHVDDHRLISGHVEFDDSIGEDLTQRDACPPTDDDETLDLLQMEMLATGDTGSSCRYKGLPLPTVGAHRLDEVFAVDIGVFEIKFSLNFLMNLTYSLGSLLVLAVGCILVVRGQTEIATVVTFLSATGRIVDPWNDVVDWARGLAMTTVKYGLVTQVLGTASQDTLAHTVGAV